jgi:hypothetical protein
MPIDSPPTERCSSADVARLGSRLRRGGTVVVAEDVDDGGNRLLTRLGVDDSEGAETVGVRFDGNGTNFASAETTGTDASDSIEAFGRLPSETRRSVPRALARRRELSSSWRS